MALLATRPWELSALYNASAKTAASQPGGSQLDQPSGHGPITTELYVTITGALGFGGGWAAPHAAVKPALPQRSCASSLERPETGRFTLSQELDEVPKTR